MAVFGVELCLSALFACAIISMPIVQGRNLRRHHGHHSHSNNYDFEESELRDLSEHLEDEPEYHDSYSQTERRRYPRVLDRSLEYEDTEERVLFPRRYKHEYGLRNYEFSQGKEDMRRYDDFETSPIKFVPRRKRHNKRSGTVNYKHKSEQDEKDLLTSRQRDLELELLQSGENGGLHPPFELEVKEAQNKSICNYTVVSIPDTRGSRVPKDLEHIKCNHAGSSCHDTGAYCCVQTYRNIEVFYGDGSKETMKIYVGCICALQIFNGLQLMESSLPVND